MKPMSLNALQNLKPPEVINFLQHVASISLNESQKATAEAIAAKLGSDSTISDFVEQAKQIADLKQFALNLEAFCLPIF